MGNKLSQTEIYTRLAELAEWATDGKKLFRRFEFKNFAESLGFVNMVGDISEEHNHHPDIEFGWGYANITFTTHDAKGLTAKDFELAGFIDCVQAPRTA
jgi:4a-hydroxytetrahydrobiopterin dehydratase